MTTELQATRKKRTIAEANPTSDGDHRKRRRNRTTQSCLNCHTSKRMVPSLWPLHTARSGETGLCVYEVDDPSQRTDIQDEGSHLRQRVAELEGVIRELKNKPHPRWVQAGSTPEVEFEKWHARSQSRSAAEQRQTEQQQTEQQTEPESTSPSRTACSALGPRDESCPPPQLVSPLRARSALTFPQPPADLTNTSSFSPYFSNISTPLSTPSPSIMTPTDEYTQSRALVVGEQPLAGEFEFASMFMSYPGFIGYENNLEHNVTADNLDDTCRSNHCYDSSPHDHCSCLTEGSSYNVVLELSLRLRKAAHILSRSAYHHLGSNNCTLNQRIVELDALATMTLGNITTPPTDVDQICPQQPPFSRKFIPPSSTFDTASGRTMPAPTVSPQTLQGIRSWDIMSSVSDPSPICEDSFMLWDHSRHG
ncbi:uncharacterized protein EDB93DRAFT_1086897 [Suillus bovinus]|uniref:uncharacterized protein n=1 Tax=Suillus bovinus TaxID=48563 RepID=UPI001B86BF69|nr:uncharacterized protein EDB93DRAFT_1086897 [Suillus bovinus]KAG2145985.1 hypothetical protein EDB93DRAFT_1086897 [Suillus bovinus]